jgi:hypothetical protein
MVAAAQAGKPLYETVEYEGEKDLYALCEDYINSLSGLITELEREGVIT